MRLLRPSRFHAEVRTPHEHDSGQVQVPGLVGRHVAFLRAINTGNRRAKNPQLSEVLEGLEASFAAGFLASGNIVFDADIGPGFVERLEEAYLDALGFDVPVILRTAIQTRQAAEKSPFTAKELAASEGKLYVGLIKTSPDPQTIAAIESMATDRDRVVVIDGDMYWLPEAGEYMSDLSVPAVERIAGPMTVRAQNTLIRLSAKFL